MYDGAGWLRQRRGGDRERLEGAACLSAVLLYTTFQNKFPRVLSRASVSECRGQYRQEARAVTRQPAPSRGPTYERGNSRLWLDIVLPLALLTRGEEKRGKLEKRVGSQYRAGIVRVVAVLLVDLVRHGLYDPAARALCIGAFVHVDLCMGGRRRHGRPPMAQTARSSRPGRDYAYTAANKLSS